MIHTVLQMYNVKCKTVTSVNQEHKVLQRDVTYSTLINYLNVKPILPAKTDFQTPPGCPFEDISSQL